jgi:hypothetical protein
MFKTLIILFLILIFLGTVNAQDADVSKFEIGGQFTVLSRNKPTPIFQSPTIFDGFEDSHNFQFSAGVRFRF